MSTPDETTASSNTITPTIAPPVTPSRATILVVEDDRSIRRYLEVILERKGYRVVVAADGLEAMKAALTHEVDAVVTDAIMPHLSGLELCRFLRNHPKLSRLPVVLLSGFESAAAAQETNDRPDVYLAKPVQPDDLVNCLDSLLLKAA
jgi:CheY-like chemotaxis protein